MIQHCFRLDEKIRKKIRSSLHMLKCYDSPGIARKPLEMPKFQFALDLLYDGGFRIDELCNLQVNDIEYDNSRIRVKEAKGGKRACKNSWRTFNQKKHMWERFCKPTCSICHGETKVRRAEYVTVQDTTYDKIEKFITSWGLKKDDYLFSSPSFYKKPIGSRFFWEKMVEVDGLINLNYYEELDDKVISNLHPHAYRKALALDLFDAGFGINHIMIQLRHKSMTPVIHYLKPSRLELQELRNDPSKLKNRMAFLQMV